MDSDLESLLKCEICGLANRNYADFLRHRFAAHEYTVKACFFNDGESLTQFYSKSQAEQEERSLSIHSMGGRIHCPKCPGTYLNPHSLNTHLKKKHNGRCSSVSVNQKKRARAEIDIDNTDSNSSNNWEQHRNPTLSSSSVTSTTSPNSSTPIERSLKLDRRFVRFRSRPPGYEILDIPINDDIDELKQPKASTSSTSFVTSSTSTNSLDLNNNNSEQFRTPLTFTPRKSKASTLRYLRIPTGRNDRLASLLTKNNIAIVRSIPTSSSSPAANGSTFGLPTSRTNPFTSLIPKNNNSILRKTSTSSSLANASIFKVATRINPSAPPVPNKNIPVVRRASTSSSSSASSSPSSPANEDFEQSRASTPDSTVCLSSPEPSPPQKTLTVTMSSVCDHNRSILQATDCLDKSESEQRKTILLCEAMELRPFILTADDNEQIHLLTAKKNIDALLAKGVNTDWKLAFPNNDGS